MVCHTIDVRWLVSAGGLNLKMRPVDHTHYAFEIADVNKILLGIWVVALSQGILGGAYIIYPMLENVEWCKHIGHRQAFTQHTHRHYLTDNLCRSVVLAPC